MDFLEEDEEGIGVPVDEVDESALLLSDDEDQIRTISREYDHMEEKVLASDGEGEEEDILDLELGANEEFDLNQSSGPSSSKNHTAISSVQEEDLDFEEDINETGTSYTDIDDQHLQEEDDEEDEAEEKNTRTRFQSERKVEDIQSRNSTNGNFGNPIRTLVDREPQSQGGEHRPNQRGGGHYTRRGRGARGSFGPGLRPFGRLIRPHGHGPPPLMARNVFDSPPQRHPIPPQYVLSPHLGQFNEPVFIASSNRLPNYGMPPNQMRPRNQGPGGPGNFCQQVPQQQQQQRLHNSPQMNRPPGPQQFSPHQQSWPSPNNVGGRGMSPMNNPVMPTPGAGNSPMMGGSPRGPHPLQTGPVQRHSHPQTLMGPNGPVPEMHNAGPMNNQGPPVQGPPSQHLSPQAPNAVRPIQPVFHHNSPRMESPRMGLQEPRGPPMRPMMNQQMRPDVPRGPPPLQNVNQPNPYYPGQRVPGPAMTGQQLGGNPNWNTLPHTPQDSPQMGQGYGSYAPNNGYQLPFANGAYPQQYPQYAPEQQGFPPQNYRPMVSATIVPGVAPHQTYVAHPHPMPAVPSYSYGIAGYQAHLLSESNVYSHEAYKAEERKYHLTGPRHESEDRVDERSRESREDHYESKRRYYDYEDDGHHRRSPEYRRRSRSRSPEDRHYRRSSPRRSSYDDYRPRPPRRYDDEDDRDRRGPKRKSEDYSSGKDSKRITSRLGPRVSESRGRASESTMESKREIGLDDEYLRKIEAQKRMRDEVLRKKEERRMMSSVGGDGVKSNSQSQRRYNDSTASSAGHVPKNIYVNPKSFKGDMTVLNTNMKNTSSGQGSSQVAAQKPQQSSNAGTQRSKTKTILRIVKNKKGEIISKSKVLIVPKHQQDGPMPH